MVDSFWVHHNPSNTTECLTIAPDSFFKILIYVQDGVVIDYFKTGVWVEPKKIEIPPRTHTLGCRFNILAPEYLFRTSIAYLLNTSRKLDTNFLNIGNFTFSDFADTIGQCEKELLRLRGKQNIAGHKLRLAQAVYLAKGSLSVAELADQISIPSRTINRYFAKYLGLSLKEYFNIQRAFRAYLDIRSGRLSPTSDFYDQSHYIREIRKYTGESPRKIFKGINDRFIQLRNIESK